MLITGINGQKFSLPTSIAELNKTQFYTFIENLKGGHPKLFQLSMLFYLMPKPMAKAVQLLAEPDRTNYLDLLLQQCQPLFTDFSQLPKWYLVLENPPAPNTLDYFTFGEWCLLCETLNSIMQAGAAQDPEDLMNLNRLITRQHFHQPTDINAPADIIELSPADQTVLVLYASACIETVSKIEGYSRFFESHNQNQPAAAAAISNEPFFGWFTIANDIARQQHLGNLNQVYKTNLHQVLMYLTEEKIAADKTRLNKQIEKLKS